MQYKLVRNIYYKNYADHIRALKQALHIRLILKSAQINSV